MKYTEIRRVDAHDTDFSEELRPASLLRYMQTAANLQLYTAGPSHDELRAAGRAFVLSRVAVDILAPVKAYEELTVSSWPCESRGYAFERAYSAERDGIVVARGYSVWALVDVTTRKLYRVSEQELRFTTDPPLFPDMPLRFTVPRDCETLFKHRVSYGEADQNRHMNNTRYLDMFCDCLDMQKYRATGFSVSYLAEAPMGEELTVTGSANGNEYYFRTIRKDGKTNAEACIRTESR